MCDHNSALEPTASQQGTSKTKPNTSEPYPHHTHHKQGNDTVPDDPYTPHYTHGSNSWSSASEDFRLLLYPVQKFTQEVRIKLEWGCPNGTNTPPRQPIQTIQVMHQIGKQLCARNHFQ